MDRTFEMSVAAFAPPTVGFVTQHFYGYEPPNGNSSDRTSDLRNGIALSKGLFATMAVPFFLCCAIYTFLYFTYPKDIKDVRISLERVSMVPLTSTTEQENVGVEIVSEKDLLVRS